ncbi:MAG: alpha/beta fold hydrolase [Nitrososphaerota archaeon]|nr:alpha/beta fold hydrolase [Nitrososphaerota archaeon]
MANPNFVSKGDGDETLLFVHGLGENLESWSDQVDYFSKQKYRAVALDLRGHGRSEAGSGRIEMEGFAEDVFEVLHSLGAEEATLCGLSMGALVVLEAYKRRPEIFESMILVSAIPQYPPSQTNLIEKLSMREVGEQVSGFAVALTASKDLKQKIANMVAATDKRSYIESAEAACAQDYTDVLRQVSVPTLLIVGELDYITPPEAAKFMQKRIPNCQMKIMKGVGHLPNREHPQEFNTIVEQFLKANIGVKTA